MMTTFSWLVVINLGYLVDLVYPSWGFCRTKKKQDYVVVVKSSKLDNDLVSFDLLLCCWKLVSNFFFLNYNCLHIVLTLFKFCHTP